MNEAVRLGTPIRSFSRHTTTDVDIAGITIPRGARVMMLFASANRDEQVFDNPDQFDVTRDPEDQLGFGSGIHMYIGMHLAQLEMMSLLRAMISRVGRIDIGQPEIALNNTIAPLASLPTTFRADMRGALVSEAPRSQPSLMSAEVIDRQKIAQNIVSLTLRSTTDTPLPLARAGAHIDVHIQEGLVRQYSLTGQMLQTYEIAVQREPDSRGGSVAMHDSYRVGSHMTISHPRNNFPLDSDASYSMLFSGGIGLTPILAMAWELHTAMRPFDWHVSARSKERLAHGKTIAKLPFADNIHLHFDDTPTGHVDIPGCLQNCAPETHVYVCGPEGYMEFVQSSALSAGLAAHQIHVEHFGAEIDVEGDSFEIIARKSQVTVKVGPSETILSALNLSGIKVPKWSLR